MAEVPPRAAVQVPQDSRMREVPIPARDPPGARRQAPRTPAQRQTAARRSRVQETARGPAQRQEAEGEGRVHGLGRLRHRRLLRSLANRPRAPAQWPIPREPRSRSIAYARTRLNTAERAYAGSTPIWCVRSSPDMLSVAEDRWSSRRSCVGYEGPTTGGRPAQDTFNASRFVRPRPVPCAGAFLMSRSSRFGITDE